MSLTTRLCRVLVAAACVAVAAAQAAANSTPVFVFSKDALLGNSLTARLGENVSMTCSFADKDWSLRIVRWHPNKAANRTRKFLDVLVDQAFSVNFSAIMKQFPEFAKRMSFDSDSNGALTFNIANYQLEDAGDFGCYAVKGSDKTPIVSLTVKNFEFITFADMPGDQQLNFNISAGQNIPITFNCSIFSIYGYQDVTEEAWFDTCNIFDTSGKKLEKANCDGKRIVGTLVEKRNLTEGGRYGEFWPRTFVRTKLSTNITINQAFYNKSVGCFIRKSNSSTLAYDFQTIVRPGVDLHLDPANFRCSPHHITVKNDSVIELWCNVRRPMYRQLRVFWEVVDPSQPGKTYECDSNTSCRNFTGLSVVNATEKEDENLYVKEIYAKAYLKIDPTTVRYKLRVVATYMVTKRFESDYFTMTMDLNDAARSAGAWLRQAAWLSWSLAVAAALALRL